MPIGAGIAGAASSIAGGIIGNNAAGAASKAAQQAAATGNQILATTQNQTTGNLQPFVNYGQSAATSLEGLLGIGGNPAASAQAFQNYLGSTNYNFVLGQGENAVKTANAPAFNSGATAKALDTYATGQAGSALQGYENILTGGVGQGIQAGSSEGAINTQSAAAQASNLLAAAGVTANADIYGSSALTNAIKGGVSGLSSAAPGAGSALSGLFGGGASGAGTTGPFNQAGYEPFAATASLI